MEQVFKALADPTRRTILDRLRDTPGLPLKALCQGTDMTRFGVMKHLALLEQAGLVVTRRQGREKRHYLNPVPLEAVVGRWVGQFARHRAQTLLGLKDALERRDQTMTDDTALAPLVFQIVIRASADEVWRGITDPALTRQYFHDTAVTSDFKTGAPIVFENPDGSPAVDGQVLEADPPRKLVITWKVRYNPDVADEPASRVTFEITEHGPFSRLTLIHDGFKPGSKVYDTVSNGWPFILANLKTLLETGAPMGDLAAAAR